MKQQYRNSQISAKDEIFYRISPVGQGIDVFCLIIFVSAYLSSANSFLIWITGYFREKRKSANILSCLILSLSLLFIIILAFLSYIFVGFFTSFSKLYPGVNI